MSDTKKYYYLKLKDNFFDSEGIKVLESMPNGVYYSNILLKLYVRSLKSDGVLKFNNCLALDERMIATITGIKISIVKKGMSLLTEMGYIKRLEDGTIYMNDFESFIGKSSSEADRKKLKRQMSAKSPSLSADRGGYLCEDSLINVQVSSDKRPPEIDIDKKLESKLENKERDNKIHGESVSLLNDFEKTTGSVGTLNLAALKKAVELHGAENVKMAMDKALEKNKPTMTYINGILKNWALEGYPKEGEQNGNGGFGKNNGAGSNEFSGFKPKEPRTLTEGERAVVEAELI